MANRLDRRVQRTQKLLRESLMALILEEGYDAISIQDITDKANLGRATFYLHFKDKDELLLDVMDQMMGDFMAHVPQLSEVKWQFQDKKGIEKLFNFAADHYDLFRILIIGSGGITASRQLQCRIAENIESDIQSVIDEQDAQPLVPPNFVANYFAGSLLAIIYWWLDNNLPYDASQMADMFQKINLLDRDTLIGIYPDKAQTNMENEKKKRGGKRKHKKDKELIMDIGDKKTEQEEAAAPFGKMEE